MNKEELKKRTKDFALRVFRFIATLQSNKSNDVIFYQLLKSSSSVAANYRAVCRGKSSADFLNKLKVVDEEADESLFWLEFINELELKCDKRELNLLIKEANELVAIFSSAIRTIKSKNPNSKILNPN
ncbi:MAG: four helix bundle protein [Bacteroidales bacterium]|nr:four helix bundle protein [Bacteroidales bacterium]